MKEFRVHLTRVSGNSKTGGIPVTTTPKDTCPNECPLKGEGCYADIGPLGFHWNNVTKGNRLGKAQTNLFTLEKLCEEIRGFRGGQAWRHCQAGDQLGEGSVIDVEAMEALTKANKGRRGYTYTHKPVEESDPIATSNRLTVKLANEGGFVVNLSANNLDHADRLASLKIGPIVTVLPSNASKISYTPQGRKVVLCPAQQEVKYGGRTLEITCQNCMLCQKPDRAFIIGFAAHGPRKRLVNEMLIS